MSGLLNATQLVRLLHLLYPHPRGRKQARTTQPSELQTAGHNAMEASLRGFRPDDVVSFPPGEKH